MGHGDCDNLSHSMTVPMATDEADVLQRIATQLFGLFHIDVKDIRGMGLQVSKLESADQEKQGHERNSIRSWLASSSARLGEDCRVSSLAGKSPGTDTEEQINGNIPKLASHSSAHHNRNIGQLGTDLTLGANLSNDGAPMHQDSALPSLSDLDVGVIESLPPELFSEINDMYGGKLTDFMLKRKGKTVDGEGGTEIEEISPVPNLSASVVTTAEEGRQPHLLPDSKAGISTMITSASNPEDMDLMPSSLSQVDVSVLEQLPEELRGDLLGFLPAHRKQGCGSDATPAPHDPFHFNSSEIQPRF